MPTDGGSVRCSEASYGMKALQFAFSDLRDGVLDWRLWTFLARHEIHARYRRSTLGPFWLTLSMSIQVLAMGLVWGTLFNIDSSQFIPYLTLGILIWAMIVGVIGEGCSVFISASGYITQTNRPLSTYVFQLVLRNLLVSSHTFAVYLMVAVFYGMKPTLATLLTLPGLFLFIAALSWTPFVLGPIGARFRDIPQVVQNILMVTFFVTPIMWKPEMLASRAYIATFNPLSHLVDVLRLPLLGQAPTAVNWIVVIAVTCLGWIAAITVFSRSRARIAYWL